MAYDPATGNLAPFGGNGSSGDLNSTWTYGYPPGTPSAPMGLTATAANARVSLAWTATRCSLGGTPSGVASAHVRGAEGPPVVDSDYMGDCA